MNLFELSSKELSKKSGVYKLSAGGHIYIGSSKNLYARLIEHRRDLSNNNHANKFLQNVCNKHGIKNLEVEIVEFCSPEDRITKESNWIKTLNADINQTDPVTHELSEESKQQLSESIKQGRLSGKYKTKFDLCKVECYDYFGDLICIFEDKEDAAQKLNWTKKKVQNIASGYKKGLSSNGIRLRYSDSSVPVQKFDINPQYLGKYYDFYYKDEQGNEQLAFHDVKDLYAFMASQLLLKKDSITIFPKLKTL